MLLKHLGKLAERTFEKKRRAITIRCDGAIVSLWKTWIAEFEKPSPLGEGIGET
jgi:hypothetical protein